MYRLESHIANSPPSENSSPSFEALWNLRRLKQVTRSVTTDVAMVRLVEAPTKDAPRKAFLKRYWYPTLRRKVKGLFRNTFFGKSRAKAEFENLSRLHALGLNYIKPLAFGEERSFRFLCRAFILTESANETMDLDSFLRSSSFTGRNPGRRGMMLCALGRWIAMLHSRGYHDRDLHARNILVHSGRRRLCFSKIDSPKGSGGRKPPVGLRPYTRDLKDLDNDLRRLVSRTDRLRVLLAYTGAGRADGAVRHLIGKIL